MLKQNALMLQEKKSRSTVQARVPGLCMLKVNIWVVLPPCLGSFGPGACGSEKPPAELYTAIDRGQSAPLPSLYTLKLCQVHKHQPLV